MRVCRLLIVAVVAISFTARAQSPTPETCALPSYSKPFVEACLANGFETATDIAQEVAEAGTRRLLPEVQRKLASGTPLPFDPTAASTLSPNDDASSEAITLPGGITIFGKLYNSLWVNNNGGFTFDGALSAFTPFALTNGARSMVVAWFGDVDTRSTDCSGCNQVTYGLSSELTYARDLIFGPSSTAEVDLAFVGTWKRVGYFFQHVDKLNTFQILLARISNGDAYVCFFYEQLEWTTGDASGGVNGLGGIVARAGYSDGLTNSFELPLSGAATDAQGNGGALDIALGSNEGRPAGQYCYNIGRSLRCPAGQVKDNNNVCVSVCTINNGGCGDATANVCTSTPETTAGFTCSCAAGFIGTASASPGLNCKDQCLQATFSSLTYAGACQVANEGLCRDCSLGPTDSFRSQCYCCLKGTSSNSVCRDIMFTVRDKAGTRTSLQSSDAKNVLASANNCLVKTGKSDCRDMANKLLDKASLGCSDIIALMDKYTACLVRTPGSNLCKEAISTVIDSAKSLTGPQTQTLVDRQYQCLIDRNNNYLCIDMARTLLNTPSVLTAGDVDALLGQAPTCILAGTSLCRDVIANAIGRVENSNLRSILSNLLTCVTTKSNKNACRDTCIPKITLVAINTCIGGI